MSKQCVAQSLRAVLWKEYEMKQKKKKKKGEPENQNQNDHLQEESKKGAYQVNVQHKSCSMSVCSEYE